MLGVLCGGCAPAFPSIARDSFTASFACPNEKLATRQLPSASDARYVVMGCGRSMVYSCAVAPVTFYDGNGRVLTQDRPSCGEAQRVAYQSSDGSVRETWLADEVASHFEVSKEAAVASAAHDLSCARGAISAIGSDERGFVNILEGCGARITYQLVEGGVTRRYVAVSRMSLSSR
jgi:hypothetical protein